MSSFFSHRRSPEEIVHLMSDMGRGMPAVVAVERIIRPNDMAEFFNAFVLYLEKYDPAASRISKVNGLSKREGALALAKGRISRALRGYDEETKQKWNQVMANTEISEQNSSGKPRHEFTIKGHHLPHILRHSRGDDLPPKRS